MPMNRYEKNAIKSGILLFQVMQSIAQRVYGLKMRFQWYYLMRKNIGAGPRSAIGRAPDS